MAATTLRPEQWSSSPSNPMYRGSSPQTSYSSGQYSGTGTTGTGVSAPQVTSYLGAHDKPIEGRIEETITEPPQVQRIQKPTVIQEVIRPRETIEVNPVIYRDREKLEVSHIVQPLREKVIMPTSYEERNLPMGSDKEFRESDEKFLEEYRKNSSAYRSSSTTEQVERQTIHKEPIIREHVHFKLIEEVQPILYKEVEVPRVIRTTVPVQEKLQDQPRNIQYTLPPQDLGVSYGQLPQPQVQPAMLIRPMEPEEQKQFSQQKGQQQPMMYQQPMMGQPMMGQPMMRQPMMGQPMMYQQPMMGQQPMMYQPMMGQPMMGQQKSYQENLQFRTGQSGQSQQSQPSQPSQPSQQYQQYQQYRPVQAEFRPSVMGTPIGGYGRQGAKETLNFSFY